MTKNRDKAYLVHIIESIELLSVHLSLLEEGTSWYQNPTVREAVLRTLQTMAESCQNLSDDVKQQMPEIEWKKIGGFRNVLAHDYLGDIDYSIVSEIMENYLTVLKSAVERYYKSKYK